MCIEHQRRYRRIAQCRGLVNAAYAIAETQPFLAGTKQSLHALVLALGFLHLVAVGPDFERRDLATRHGRRAPAGELTGVEDGGVVTVVANPRPGGVNQAAADTGGRRAEGERRYLGNRIDLYRQVLTEAGFAAT